VYDSRVWTVGTEIINGGQFWQRSSAGGLPVGGDFRLVTEGESGRSTFSQSTQQCGDLIDAGGKHHPQYRTTYENYTYQEPNGTNHRINIDRLYQSSPYCTGGGQVPTGSGYDASGYKMVVDDNNITVYAPDGSRVTPLLTSTSATVSPGTSMVQDTNGNFLTYALGSAPNTTNVVDSLGRIPVLTTFSGDQTFIDYLCEQGCNPSNGDRARITLNTVYIPIATQFNAIYQGTGVRESSGLTGLLGSIVLPDGTSYQFQYDSYGEMTGITLPTGGQATYGYANFTDYTGYTNRWVTSRTVDGNTWSFPPTLPPCSTPPCPLVVNLTTPPYNDGTSTASDTYAYTYAVSNGNVSGAWITQEQYFRGPASGTPLLTKATDYGFAGACPAFPGIAGQDPVVIRETLTWPLPTGTLSKKAEYCYDNFYNLTTSKRWDYQPNGNFAAAPDREVDTTYVTDPAYVGANILRLPLVSTSFGPGHAQTAQTTRGYDETSLQPSNISQNHATPTSPRANLTSTSKWLNTGTTPVTSNTTWYDSGEVYQSKDPLGHTAITYFDSTGAYPNKVCNALNQCSYPVHDFNTGLMASFTDMNGAQAGDPTHTTTYTFDTSLRPLCANAPDGGQTCLSYPDANHVSRQQKINATLPPDASTTVFDGLGRVSQTQHTLPACISKVDTTYDPVGAPLTVSNPYCTTADPTYGITQSFHDALGRGVKTIRQDGSVSSSAYSVRSSGTMNGTCVTAADEAGKQRMACHNGFEELIEVDEPNALAQGASATASVAIIGNLQETIITGGTPHSAASGSPLSSVVLADGSSHTFYFDSSQHICQVYWNSVSGWVNEDLTAITGNTLVGSGSGLTSVVLTNGTFNVFYLGLNQHVYDMYWSASGGWGNQDLTAITGNTLAAPGSALTSTSLSDGSPNGTVHAFYFGQNQHVYHLYFSTAAGWANQDLTALTGNILAASASDIAGVLLNNNSLNIFYLDTNQDINDIYWSSTANWGNSDITAITGHNSAAVGSKLTGLAPATGSILSQVFYEGSNQHIYNTYYSSSLPGWQTQDLTAAAGNTLAALNSKLTSTIASGAWYVGYVGAANQHDYALYCCGPGWSNADLNAAAGSTIAVGTGSALSSVGSADNLFVHEFYLSGNQHVYDLYYNAGLPGWQGADLTGTSKNAQLDAGTVTLTVGAFTASACFGNSTNPVCSGKPVNYSSSDVATALAVALNAAGSPVSASASGSTINMTWLQPGAFSPSVAPLSSSHDNSGLFPGDSFSSAATAFSGGQSAPFDNTSYSTTYQYDGLGNLLRVDQKGSAPSDSTQWRTRQFTYDSLSRLLSASNPESGVITYSYDADSELLMKISPAPNQTGSATQTVSYCYDPLHRVTARDYSAHTYTPPACPITTPIASYVYDSGGNAKGHLTSLADQAGSGIYGYDNLGRLTTETRVLYGANNGAISKSASYEYNLDGSLYKLHYPSSAIVTYTPGIAGLTLSAADSGSSINYVTNATYGPASSLTGFVSGNSPTFTGITNSFIYNRRLQPLTMSATAPSQTVFSIGYDFHAGNGASGFGTDNGNVFGIFNYKDTTRNQTFTYDPLNRLISAQNAGTNCATMVLQNKTEYWGNSYSYDAWGNLLQKNVTKCGAEGLTVTADAHNWIHATAPDYQYDAAGNMTFDATASLSYTFDQENRLTGAAGYTYTYDSDGNRVRKSNGNLAANGTLYWYMTPGVVAETDLAGTLKSEYVFFDGERVARRDGATGAGGVFYYFSDHLKTASVITDSAGVIKAESDYYPWGGELQFVNNDTNDYKFTGKKRDIETGLDYFGARYYSNGLGRWVSADWSSTPVPVPYADFGDPQSLNLYGFVGGNPASKADPDGHCPAGDCPIIIPKTLTELDQQNQTSFFHAAASAAKFVWRAFSEIKSGPAIGPDGQLLPRCSCATPNNQNTNKEQNNNNSKSTNQQESGGQDKKVPNPNGKNGDAAHQETIGKAEKDMQDRGLTTQREYKVQTPGGEKSSRYVDVVGKDAEGNVVEMHQAGKQTQAGNPVARETRALNDIENATGKRPQFDPTNKPKE
jgi:RHS repeat-associated protein